jgi:hypothetical protein
MIRLEPARCVAQFQSVLNQDPLLAAFVIPKPLIEQPDMDPDPLFALTPTPWRAREVVFSYFDSVRNKLQLKTLRQCQTEAFAALGITFGPAVPMPPASCPSARERRRSGSLLA